MADEFGVALVTRIPFTAAPKFDRDDVVFAVVVRATGVIVQCDAVDFNAVDLCSH